MTQHRHTLAAAAVVSIASLFLAACGGGGDTEPLVQAQAQPGSPDGRPRALAVAQNPATGVLRFEFVAMNTDAKFVVGPAPGVVMVEGVEGVPNGTVYTGVTGIEWRSDAGNNRMVFEVNQADDFDISVTTGASNVELDVKWVVPPESTAPITPSVEVTAGAGTRKIQVQLESFGRDVDFGLRTAFMAGNTELKGELQYKEGSVRAGGRMALDFGPGLNKVSLLVDSKAQHLNLDLAPRYMQELETKVISSDPSSTAHVRYAPVGVSSGSKIGFEMLSAAPSITLDYDVTGSSGLDEVKLGLTTLGAATVNSNVRGFLYGANDKLELAYKGLPGARINLTGAMDLGPGDDEAVLLREGISTTAPMLSCDAGIDKAVGWPVERTLACELF